jgi:protein-L-isoaspartate(D-aspartate) O-methyltransferase
VRKTAAGVAMNAKEMLGQIETEFHASANWTGRSCLSPRVAEALRSVRREAFVSAGSEDAAYENRPLAIGHGQTISQPFIVALMTELLELKPADRVLEVGTGSGYQAAVLAELTSKVCSIEIISELAARAAAALSGQSYGNVELRTGDGGLGWPESAPFDAIIVTAAARDVPTALLAQLKPGGRMVIPVGASDRDQELLLITKDKAEAVKRQVVLPVAFVPLTSGHRD